MTEIKIAKYVPNYDIVCFNCGQTPTVDVYEDGELVTHIELCGICCFGEAECIDPEKW